MTYAERVVRELQRRGLFRRAYEGTSLRENLRLRRPENRHRARQARERSQAVADPEQSARLGY